ncbi:MAG: UDP-N-acetylmuramate--L-alanine ligase [Candidatus Dasytiphilus stammeri]
MGVSFLPTEKTIHFVGIGGIGMHGIASVLAKEGYKISGSDIRQTSITEYLISLGITVYLHHHHDNIKNASLVVRSTAISSDNPEIIAAYKEHIPVISRGEMLAELMQFRYGIAIAGTHGKTTTTAMIASILYEAHKDPTFINGGLIKSFGTYNRLGKSKYFIVEADESDASFLHLCPIVTVITNIESEHMNTYGNLDFLKKNFLDFLHKIPFYGHAIICLDNNLIRDLIPNIKRRIITYGFSKNADVRIMNYKQNGQKAYFSLRYAKNNNIFMTLNHTPGMHNALNAAASFAVANQQNINNKIICHALAKFQGIKRRFELLGEFYLKNVNNTLCNVLIIDDYGHHPTELEVTIKTVRLSWPTKRLVMIFQPHRFTRTRDLYYDFVNVLSQVDILILLNIYSAGERAIPKINSKRLSNNIRKYGKINPILVTNDNVLLKIVRSVLLDNDVILIQGAGNIRELANILLSEIKDNND